MRYWPVYGGGETITATLSNKFINRGHNVFIAYTYDNTCDPMPYRLHPNIVSKKMHTIEHYTSKNVDDLRAFLVKNQIDVMINQWGSTQLCYKAKKGSKTKLFTCWHLDVLQEASQPISARQKLIHKISSRLYNWYEKKKKIRVHTFNYKLSDKYIFLSESFVETYKKISKNKDKQHKLTAISNPLTYNEFYDINKYSHKKKELLFVGRIYEYHKRLSYILKIWKQILADDRFNEWSLKIVGDGPDMAETKALSDNLKLSRLSFEGFQNPRPYYRDASIFLMTSSFEGFGMTLVEAQQYAVVPIVMDTYSSLHDIIENENNGIIVENDNIEGYTQQLMRLMTEENYRLQLASQGLETCKDFRIDAIADKWESLSTNIIQPSNL